MPHNSLGKKSTQQNCNKFAKYGSKKKENVCHISLLFRYKAKSGHGLIFFLFLLMMILLLLIIVVTGSGSG